MDYILLCNLYHSQDTEWFDHCPSAKQFPVPLWSQLLSPPPAFNCSVTLPTDMLIPEGCMNRVIHM